MKSYIHLYRTNSEFTEVYNGPDYDEPWISLTEENMEVNYNKTHPEPSKELTSITFENLTWITDIPSTGGTATKDNCTYTIMAKYIGSEPENITSQVNNVTGELVVAETTATTRQSVGTLILTAEYKGISCTGSVVAYQKKAVDLKEPLAFKISSPGTINWKAIKDSPKTIEYKLNDGGWISITSNTGASAPTITVNAGDKIQFRGDNATYGVYEKYTTFSGSTAEFEIEGNIMSLINSTNFSTLTTLQNAYTFYKLFEGCTGLTSAENLILPATTLSGCCYQYMFYNCTSLVTAPALPATTLAGCCYQDMFYNCTSLVTAPALPAATLELYCYQDMFYNCTSLTTAPALPATTLARYCYYGMFYNCSSLTTAPELPATTLIDGCYQNMFWKCTSLNYIKCLATDISATKCTDGWVDGVAANGTFAKSPDMSGWTTGKDGIPGGWTVEDAS